MQILIIPLLIIFMASIIVLPKGKYYEKLFFHNNIIFNASFDSVQVSEIKLNRAATIFMIINDLEIPIPTINQIKILHNGNDIPTQGLIQKFINESLNFTITDLNYSTEYRLFYAAISDDDLMESDIHTVVINTLERPKSIELLTTFTNNFSVIFYIPLLLVGFTLLITKIIEIQEPLVNPINRNSVCKISPTFDPKQIEKSLLLPSPILIANSKFSSTEKSLVRAKVKALMEESAELEDRRICGICCHNSKDVIFLNCGHIFCCSKCASNLIKCPLDNQEISWKLVYERIDYLGQKDQEIFESNMNDKLHTKQLTEFDSDENWLKLYENLSYDIKNHKKIEFCGICFRRPREYLFLECGHVFCCSMCAKNNIRCPLDQKKITKKIRLFYA